MRDLDPKEEGNAIPNNKLQKIEIGAVAQKFIFIGRGLPEAMKVELTSLLRTNLDLFAWAHEDMPRIDPKVIFHRLVIDLKV